VALALLLLLEAVLVLVLLEAEAVDSRMAAMALLLVAEREVLPSPLSSVSFPFRFLPFLLLLWFSSPPFFSFGSLFFLSPFSLFRFFRSPPLSSVFSVFFRSVSSPSSSLLMCCLLLIEPSEWLFVVEHGEQSASRPLGATAKARPPPPRFSGRCAVGGRPLCPVGGLQAREGPAKKFKTKGILFSFFPAACLGGRRKMNSVVQNDTVLLFLFFFFIYI